MPVRFEPYRVSRILNKRKHADHWFWDRYSAAPYVGCEHACHYCYSRATKYCPFDDPPHFGRIVRVKVNAAQRLRAELSRVPRDAVSTGDYQPVEMEYGLSRHMLQVCLDLRFPVLLLEKSDLITRDLDLIAEVNEQAAVVVAFSIVTTLKSPRHEILRKLEPRAPSIERRFAAMERFAAAGIPTGTACMPILPGLFDDRANLESVVKHTADCGGGFVLAGGLTLADEQRRHLLRLLARLAPALLPRYERLYPNDAPSPLHNYWYPIARTSAELCSKHGIADRMARPIAPDDPLALNKLIAQRLADDCYRREIEGASSYLVWAYRKAAWAVDDLEVSLAHLYAGEGQAGLESLPNVGPRLALTIGQWIEELEPCPSLRSVALPLPQRGGTDRGRGSDRERTVLRSREMRRS